MMSVADWRPLFDEPAAFLEFDCGADRGAAERAALALCVGRLAWRNPPQRVAYGLCQHCRAFVEQSQSVPAVFFDGGGRAVHPECVEPFRLTWIGNALAALDRMGIPTTAKGGAA